MARVHLKSRLGLNAMSQWKGGSYYTRLRLSATGNIRWETGSRLNATSQDVATKTFYSVVFAPLPYFHL